MLYLYVDFQDGWQEVGLKQLFSRRQVLHPPLCSLAVGHIQHVCRTKAPQHTDT